MLQELVQQIPDVSCAPEEDQHAINYANFGKTQKICAKAHRQLSRMSLNPSPAAAVVSEEEDDKEEPPKAPKVKAKSRRARKSCPPAPAPEERLYPKLDLSDVSALPPTYSDSESMSSSLKPASRSFMPSYRRVVPSAPAAADSLSQVPEAY